MIMIMTVIIMMMMITRGLMVGTTVLWVSVYGTNQAMVQRYSTVQRRSQVMIMTMIVIVIMIMMIIIRLSPHSDSMGS